MKIAGLTWWRNNYGSILQAYALQKKLDEFDGIEYEIICQYGKKIASVDNLKDKFKKIGLAKSLKRIFWKFGMKKLRMRNENIQKFVDQNLRVSEKQLNEEIIAESNNNYDGFICGSDQIWNPALTPVTSMYWLRFVHSSKLKIAYAPSIGVDKVTHEQAEIIRSNLKDFKAISCREEGGTTLINSILGEERCVTVLDPTLMIERKIWDDICPSRQYEDHYIFVYMLRGTKVQRKLIEDFAKRKGIKIITMPFLDTEHIELYDFKFGDIKYWDASPDDFVSLIRYADYVFTDSFHCMVFSCLYHTQFFTFPKIGKSQLDRITGLQKLFHISNRMISNETTLEFIVLMKEIDWDIVDKIIFEKREYSQMYLKNAVNV